MEERPTCDKHDDCLGRIHTEINSMNSNNARLTGNIESFITELRAFKQKADKDVYDPKDGLGARVNAHGTQLTLQWGVISTIIGSAIVGIIVGTVINWLHK